ncbi:MAG: DUF554 domain-containing protein, partial [Oscillospiraceae bacterium]|nr:DUF554 domain-containing protein [Oscillospiraceae bacterium]
MIAVLVNTVAVLAGSIIGILFRNRLKESLRNSVMKALGLCTLLIGVMSAVETQELLGVIVCMVLGTLLGELLRIDDRIENAGDAIKGKLLKGRPGGSGMESFTDGFVSASILFCIGSMTIVGSLEAGIRQNYSILFAKSTMDFISSMAFGAAMGYGVTCSAAFVLVFQGALVLLSAWIGSALSDAVVTEMS